MVDAVVSFAVNRLGDFLIQEAVLIGRVRQELQWLKRELGHIQGYVAVAEEHHVDDPMVRKWLNDLAEIAYDVEDVLDKFTLPDHVEGTKESKIRCFPTMSSIIKSSKKFILNSIGKDIEKLKNKINDLPRVRELYELKSSSKQGEGKSDSHMLRRSTSYSIGEKVVGHADGIKTLLAKLLDPDPRLCTVSICGMGGLGKTTLASKLYNHLDVKMKFHYCGWVCVSQYYNTCDLLKSIIRSFGFKMEIEKQECMREDDLKRYLCESLRGDSYLLVIDDIWKIEAWKSIENAFPDSNDGSRLIITTRKKEVAKHSNVRTYVHKLRFLNDEESWQLFCGKAFGNPEANNVQEELKALGRKMVRKCQGLPIAMVVLGGLLSTKTRPREWKEVDEHIWRDLKKASNGSIHISNLFALSFNDLPYQLKPCFLYMGLFPEDSEIDVDTLIQLWVAEGFIWQEEDQKMEDVAKSNFSDLINRSLIQIGKNSWGSTTTCRVHDLLRDLAIEKARELNFSYNYDQMKHSRGDLPIVLSCRREAVYSTPDNHLWLKLSNRSLRTLLFFDPYGSRKDVVELLPMVCQNFKFLRVLNLNGQFQTQCDSLLKLIGKLILLKYLGLKEFFAHYLPRQLCNLQRLQTLDVVSGRSVELPNDISMLGELRHLYGRFGGHLRIDTSTKLQTLKKVRSQTWNKINSAKLVNLRELWIYGSPPTATREFPFDSISKLKGLKKLVVELNADDCFASLQPLSDCSKLIHLRLYGKIEELPDLHQVLPELECLLLKYSHLRDDPMPSLEKLKSLMILYLGVSFYEGTQLSCSAQGFPQLEILKVERGFQSMNWQVEDGAMPNIRRLGLPEDPDLRIPERLRSIPPPTEFDFDRD